MSFLLDSFLLGTIFSKKKVIKVEFLWLVCGWRRLPYSNIGGCILHVLPLESLRDKTVQNSPLVMSISSHSSVWFDEKKSFRGSMTGVNYFFLNGLIDLFFANWIVMLLKAVYFMTNFSNHNHINNKNSSFITFLFEI